MTISQCSVAVLIKLFIRFPLESVSCSESADVFVFIGLWSQFGWTGVLLSSRFLKFHVEICWRKKKQLQLQIGGISIHVGLLVKQRGGCLRAPGGGGGVVFPACVK